MAMNTEDSLREYLRLFVRVPLLGRIGPLARTFDFVADAAPGVKEILAVGKLAYEVRERHYDLVVVDAEASGHIVAQVGAPRVIRELVQVGHGARPDRMDARHPGGPGAHRRRRRHDAGGDAGHRDASSCSRRLDRETGVAVAAVVANRVLPALFDRREAERLRAARRAPSERARRGGRAGRAAASSPAAQLTEARRRVGDGHLERLRDGVPAGLPMLVVPELFTRATGRRVVALVADALARGVWTAG